jgi:hypothetical protein
MDLFSVLQIVNSSAAFSIGFYFYFLLGVDAFFFDHKSATNWIKGETNSLSSVIYAVKVIPLAWKEGSFIENDVLEEIKGTSFRYLNWFRFLFQLILIIASIFSTGMYSGSLALQISGMSFSGQEGTV